MLRLAAALALVLGLGGFGGYLVLIGKSPISSLETRHLRDMKDRLEAPRAYQPFTVAEFAALPRGTPVAEYSGLERRGVVLEGYIQRLLRAADGDLHLEIVENVPTSYKEPYVTGEIAMLPRTSKRGWSFERLAWDFRPWRSEGMDIWHQPPRRVRISGWLLYDYPHEEGAPRPGASEPRVSGWEIHPVTAIEVWDESREAWEAIPR